MTALPQSASAGVALAEAALAGAASAGVALAEAALASIAVSVVGLASVVALASTVDSVAGLASVDLVVDGRSTPTRPPARLPAALRATRWQQGAHWHAMGREGTRSIWDPSS